jgi:ApbE superfamily uncharacterized protein (UPF0280 family)
MAVTAATTAVIMMAASAMAAVVSMAAVAASMAEVAIDNLEERLKPCGAPYGIRTRVLNVKG